MSRFPHDLLGGRLDAERGGAVLRRTGHEVVVVSDDVAELRTLAHLAPHRAVGLKMLRRASDNRYGMVFDIDGEWTIMVRAETLIATGGR